MGEMPRDDGYQEDLTVAFDGAAGHAIEIEAGSLGTWTLTYRCGDQPVRDGGSISFWNDQTNVPCAYVPQTDDPAGWDYVTVETDGDAELELVHLARTYKDNRFCEVRVVRGELRHGDSVVLRVGAGQPTAAPPYNIERINYYVAVDHEGDGTWLYLPYCVTAAIVPGPPAKLGGYGTVSGGRGRVVRAARAGGGRQFESGRGLRGRFAGELGRAGDGSGVSGG